MSWRRAAILVAATAAVAGCGFQPLYADHAGSAAIDAQLSRVAVRQMHDREGQELTNELRDAFNPTGQAVAPSYELIVNPQISTGDVLSRSDSTAARTNSSIRAIWSLRRLSDGAVVAHGISLAHTGHDVVINDYSNVVATQSEIDRGLHEVGIDIESRVADWLKSPT